MVALSSEPMHASSVAIAGRAVLIEGASGSGKSDLALRLIDRGARLVSDDYTIVQRRGERLVARAPTTIAGRIEVRGVGIVTLPFADEVPVGLIVSIGPAVARLPETERRLVAGVLVPVLAIAPHEASAPIKIEHALALHGLTA